MEKKYTPDMCEMRHMEPMIDPRVVDNFPVGMAYVPWQNWQNVYSHDVGLNRGTIFPDLDLPFLGEEVK